MYLSLILISIIQSNFKNKFIHLTQRGLNLYNCLLIDLINLQIKEKQTTP